MSHADQVTVTFHVVQIMLIVLKYNPYVLRRIFCSDKNEFDVRVLFLHTKSANKMFFDITNFPEFENTQQTPTTTLRVHLPKAIFICYPEGRIFTNKWFRMYIIHHRKIWRGENFTFNFSDIVFVDFSLVVTPPPPLLLPSQKINFNLFLVNIYASDWCMIGYFHSMGIRDISSSVSVSKLLVSLLYFLSCSTL